MQRSFYFPFIFDTIKIVFLLFLPLISVLYLSCFFYVCILGCLSVISTESEEAKAPRAPKLQPQVQGGGHRFGHRLGHGDNSQTEVNG